MAAISRLLYAFRNVRELIAVCHFPPTLDRTTRPLFPPLGTFLQQDSSFSIPPPPVRTIRTSFPHFSRISTLGVQIEPNRIQTTVHKSNGRRRRPWRQPGPFLLRCERQVIKIFSSGCCTDWTAAVTVAKFKTPTQLGPSEWVGCDFQPAGQKKEAGPPTNRFIPFRRLGQVRAKTRSSKTDFGRGTCFGRHFSRSIIQLGLNAARGSKFSKFSSTPITSFDSNLITAQRSMAGRDGNEAEKSIPAVS